MTTNKVLSIAFIVSIISVPLIVVISNEAPQTDFQYVKMLVQIIMTILSFLIPFRLYFSEYQGLR